MKLTFEMFQVVQSSAEIFEEDILPTAGFTGTVQFVSEKPTFGVEVAGLNQVCKSSRKKLFVNYVRIIWMILDLIFVTVRSGQDL